VFTQSDETFKISVVLDRKCALLMPMFWLAVSLAHKSEFLPGSSNWETLTGKVLWRDLLYHFVNCVSDLAACTASIFEVNGEFVYDWEYRKVHLSALIEALYSLAVSGTKNSPLQLQWTQARTDTHIHTRTHTPPHTHTIHPPHNWKTQNSTHTTLFCCLLFVIFF